MLQRALESYCCPAPCRSTAITLRRNQHDVSSEESALRASIKGDEKHLDFGKGTKITRPLVLQIIQGGSVKESTGKIAESVVIKQPFTVRDKKD